MTDAAPGVDAGPHTLVNGLPADGARRALRRCCGSSAWVDGMLARRPFATAADLYEAAAAIWRTLGRDDFLEAFSHHPRIGSGPGGPKLPEGAAADWSAEEQARVADAQGHVTTALVVANNVYAARFGYIFIVCAAGKTADEMLTLLQDRMGNDPEAELEIAASEQEKITRLRLEKLAR
jgi:2-oxo-4-hydroxy-4-carboxy-5-ureidoimidazoline decarboxylase